MKIICSFYIGVEDYLGEPPSINERESNERYTAEVSEIVYRNIGREQFEVYPAKNPAELNAVLEINDDVIHATSFSTETSVADDEEGLPVLFYLNAHFEVPENFDLEDDVDATLKVGGLSLNFEGIPELEEGE